MLNGLTENSQIEARDGFDDNGRCDVGNDGTGRVHFAMGKQRDGALMAGLVRVLVK